jgi:hypothetical protein
MLAVVSAWNATHSMKAIDAILAIAEGDVRHALRAVLVEIIALEFTGDFCVPSPHPKIPFPAARVLGAKVPTARASLAWGHR